MHIIKKLLILIIVLVSFVIIHRLLKENADVKAQIDKQLSEPKKEGFASASATQAQDPATQVKDPATQVKDPATQVKDPATKAEAEMLDKSASALGRELTLKTISEKYLDFPLREFMIKSSHNSAIIGKTASTDAIDFVLKRGCRLIDFEIHTRNLTNSKDAEFVSYSDDPKHKSINTRLTLTLEKALMFVAANAFSGISPLPDDPIFIQLRIKNNSKEMFDRTSKAITTIFGDRLYKKPVTGSTPIKELMGKVVIILDAISSRNYEKQANCTGEGVELNCIPYTQYVGLVSGTVDLPKYSYTEFYDLTAPPIMVDKSDRTDVSRFIMITPPDVGGSNISMPDIDNLKQLPVQMLLVPFYKQTDELKRYEEIFNICKSAFCPIGYFIRTQ
jgi:hypothetical protein